MVNRVGQNGMALRIYQTPIVMTIHVFGNGGKDFSLLQTKTEKAKVTALRAKFFILFVVFGLVAIGCAVIPFVIHMKDMIVNCFLYSFWALATISAWYFFSWKYTTTKPSDKHH